MLQRLAVSAALLLVSGLATATAAVDDKVVDVREMLGDAEMPKDNHLDLREVGQLIFKRVNDFRAENQLGSLQRNRTLEGAALRFAEFMATEDLFGHTADERLPSERAAAAGYDYCIILENLALEHNTAGFTREVLARRFVDGWKASPTHRESMMDPDVRETGIGVARSSGTGTYYAVQLFGRPKSDQITFDVENKSRKNVAYSLGEEQLSLPPNYVRTHTICRPSSLLFPAFSQQFRPETGDRYTVRGGGVTKGRGR